MTMTTDHGTSALAEAEAISVYEAVGGRAAVTAAVDNFYGRLLADPVLAPLFPRGVGRRGPGGQTDQGHRGPRRGQGRPGRPGRGPGGGAGPARPVVRPGHREVPRARHAGQPARLQRHQHAAHQELPGLDLRGGARPGRRGPGRYAQGGAAQLRVLHHRL